MVLGGLIVLISVMRAFLTYPALIEVGRCVCGIMVSSVNKFVPKQEIKALFLHVPQLKQKKNCVKISVLYDK